MIVIPAIDLLGGKAVRLVRGERDSPGVLPEKSQAVGLRMLRNFVCA